MDRRAEDTVTNPLCSVASKYDLLCDVYFGNRRSTKLMRDQTVRSGQELGCLLMHTMLGWCASDIHESASGEAFSSDR